MAYKEFRLVILEAVADKIKAEARAISKGTHGRLGSVEAIGEHIANAVLSMDFSAEISCAMDLVADQILKTVLAEIPTPEEEVTPEMIAAGWRTARRAHWPQLGPGPGMGEIYTAMRTARHPGGKS